MPRAIDVKPGDIVHIFEEDLTYENAVAVVKDFAELFDKSGKAVGRAATMDANGSYVLAISINKILECHAAEVADLSRTIRNLSADNDQLAEQETGR